MQPQIGILMGSQNDWDTMRHAADTLGQLGIACEARVLSAHRTPDHVVEYVVGAPARGIKAFIAGAGGAAHLAGVIASKTNLPVLGVPMESAALKGMDSLLSTVQMPAGVPVATFAIGKPGAINAAIFAAQILAVTDPKIAKALVDRRAKNVQDILAVRLDMPAPTTVA